jgi:hypothetical protein
MSFLEEHKTALYLTGTVAIPSPYPAHARVYVVASAKELGTGLTLIKIVQILDETHFATWFVNLDDVAAIRLPGPHSADKSLPFGGWIVKPADEFRKKAIESHKDEKGKSDVLLHQQAVVLVRESAPVIARFELVATADECVDQQWQYFPCPTCH